MPYRRSIVLQRGSKILLQAACLAAISGTASAQTVRENTSCPAGLNCTVSGHDADQIRSYIDDVVGNALNEQQVVNGRRPTVGAIVGISWHGRRTYFGYGKNSAAYDPDTIVEIGSITKVFTTALLVEAVRERGLSLDDRLIAYKDAIGLGGLTACAENVTLRQLADFSSGMPRLPDDLPANHSIENYSTKQFKAWVSGWTPRGTSPNSCSLPASYVYSNASVGLLGYIVSSQLGEPYGKLVADRITTPLQMSSTFLPETDGSVPAALASRLAVGRSNDYQSVSAWPYYAWFAAGALRSDAEDMLSFGEAALGNHDIDSSVPSPNDRSRMTSLEAALKTSRTMTYPVERPDGDLAFNQGLSWVEKPGDSGRRLAPLYFKDGGTNGFSTIVVVNPAKDLAIFIGVGKTNMNVDALGVRLARLIH